MNLIKLLCKSLFFITILYICPSMSQQPAPGMALTPEGAEIMEAALQEFAQAWDKMNPEEREQFFKIYDEMSQLPPEELGKMVNEQYGVEIFTPGEPTEAPLATEPSLQPQGEPTLTTEEQVSKAPKISVSQQERALETIKSIIDRVNSLLGKIQIMPEFNGKFKKWTEQGKIKGWNPSFSWESVKLEIEKLRQTLEKIREKDKKTELYTFIDDLVQSPGFEKLNSLSVALESSEPLIEIEELGFEPVSKESRKSMRQAINALIDAIFIQNTPNDLYAVIEKFEPWAKKSREAEEAASKKAIEESKRERPGKPGITAGYGEPDQPYYSSAAPSYGSYDYGSSGSGYYSPSYTPYSSTSSNEPYRNAQSDLKADTNGKKSTLGDKGSAKEDEKGEDKEKPDTKSLDENAITRLINKIDNAFDEAAKAITSDSSRLHDIARHLVERGPVDENTARNELPRAIKRIESAVENIKLIKKRFDKISADSKKSFKEEITDLYEDNKSTFDNIVRQISQAKSNLGQISAEKLHAFMGGPEPKSKKAAEPAGEGQTPDKALEEVTAESTAPLRTLEDLKNVIQELRNAISAL